MRLSTREVNDQGRLSKSPAERDWSLLLSSVESWPPLLPSFSKDTVEALDRFVQAFICKRIEYRCGQLPAVQYTDVFLPQWIAMAECRTDLMEDFFAQQGARLDEDTFQRTFGAFERLQSALRDARQERGDAGEDRHDKKITFARPVAHRLIRRSRDRFSLRSIADTDESMDSTRLSSSCSPQVPDMADTLRASLSPPPCGDALCFGDDATGGCVVLLPVAESPDGDHFTGRASGVYYGGLFHSARSSTNSNDDKARLPSAAAVATISLTREVRVEASAALPEPSADECASESLYDVTRACQGPTSRSTVWRRWWLLLFYYFLLPTCVAWFLLCGRLTVALSP
jgi:hypothetical protein